MRELEYAANCQPYTRPRVFCASLADWLDDEVDPLWLADLLCLIHRCQHLDWLLLTKRPELWRARLIAARGVMFADPADVADRIDSWLDGNPWPNIWIGTTVENQEMADKRIPELLQIPARVRFLSGEPLLGPIDLKLGQSEGAPNKSEPFRERQHLIHWVICGGESGTKARPMHPDWARSLRDQCKTADVPFLFKQWGEWLPADTLDGGLRVAVTVNCKCPDNPKWHEWADKSLSVRVGKKASGRLLDENEYDEFPIRRIHGT